ncbi:MAG: hypothetical protein WCF77_03670 [Minisyncoccia bacterium]|jgi:hypothetical protein
MWKKFFYDVEDAPTPVRVVKFGNHMMAMIVLAFAGIAIGIALSH